MLQLAKPPVHRPSLREAWILRRVWSGADAAPPSAALREPWRSLADALANLPDETSRAAEFDRLAFETGFDRDAARVAIFAARPSDPPPPDDRAGIADVALSDLTPRPKDWLWADRVLCGALTVVAGRQKAGKSSLLYELAAATTTGRRLPGDPRPPGEPGIVVFLTCEDDPADTILPRIVRAGGDPSRVRVVGGVREADDDPARPFRPSDASRLAEHIDRVEDAAGLPVKLVVLDTINNVATSATDGNSDVAVRAMLNPLIGLAGRKRFALVGTAHLRKGNRDLSDPLDAIHGSIAYTGRARSILLVVADPADPAARLVYLAGSNAARGAAPLRYALTPDPSDPDHPVFAWRDAADAPPLESALGAALKPLADRADDDGLDDWLRSTLEGREVPAPEVFAAAKANGYPSEKSVRAALRRIGGESVRTGGVAGEGRWLWRLPDAPPPPRPDAAF